MRQIVILAGLVALMSVLFASVALAMAHQCSGRPCIGTRHADTLYERPGNRVPDTIYGRGGGDVLKAQEHTRDRDRLYGNRGRDRLNVRDGDNKDTVRGGPGHDVCIADYDTEIGRGCEVWRVDFVHV
jgi:RTX calcium-binding nonapeptide repeat (4 copies)